MDLAEKYRELFEKILSEYRDEYAKLRALPETDDRIEHTYRAYDSWELEEKIKVLKEQTARVKLLGTPSQVSEEYSKLADEYYAKSEYEAEYPSFDWNDDHYRYFVYRGTYSVYKKLADMVKMLDET